MSLEKTCTLQLAKGASMCSFLTPHPITHSYYLPTFWTLELVTSGLGELVIGGLIASICNLKLASWSTVMLLSNADFTLITSTFLPHPAKFLEYKTVFLLIFESPQLNSRSGCHTRNLGGWTCPGVIRVVSSQKMCIGVGTDTWRVDWECTSKMWQLGSAHSSQERRFPAGNQEGEWDWKDK
jgi:hypothetical protein